jgi:hypothetical protein
VKYVLLIVGSAAAYDIDAAAEYAKQVPVLPSDRIEVRPIKA